jgi:hypothetical protein
MGPRWTEQEIEAYLKSETRDLVMPDGTVRAFTGLRLMWMVFDQLISVRGYTPARLVAFAVEETQLTGVPFETAFPGVLAYLDRHLLRPLRQRQQSA